MTGTLEEFKTQHFQNYKNAIKEIIHNNTNVLVDEDIMSLLRKPPLDSMDLIKSKYLALAKKNKIILDTIKLDGVLENYRNDLINCCGEIKKLRIDFLEKIVDEFKINKDTDIIKFNKKDFTLLNKTVKKYMKKKLKEAIENNLIENVNTVFTVEVEEDIKKKISDEMVKYLKGSYQRQILDNVDFKVLVKDTTLSNGTKEQGDRYLFTLANSHIFKQEEN